MARRADCSEMPGVEQALDDLELEQVGVGVPPLGAAAPGLGDRRAQQVGPGPVVQLAVGDADDRADLRAAVPRLCLLGIHGCRPSMLTPA